MGKKRAPQTTELQDVVPPTMEDINLYVAGLHEESKTLHHFVQKALGRLEFMADEINFPELKFYISCMKSYAQKSANADQEREKLMDKTIQALRKDNDSYKSEIKRLKLELKELEGDMEAGEKLNREQAKELKSLKLALDKQIQRLKPATPGQPVSLAQASKAIQEVDQAKVGVPTAQYVSSSSARMPALGQVPNIPQTLQMLKLPGTAQTAQTAQTAPIPQMPQARQFTQLTPAAPARVQPQAPNSPPAQTQTQTTTAGNTNTLPPISPNNNTIEGAMRPKSVLKRTTFVPVDDSVVRLGVQGLSSAMRHSVGAEDAKTGMRRNLSAGSRTVPVMSEVYQFKAADHIDSTSRPRGVSFKPIREESSAEPSPRRGASTRHRTPSTRGRSQSVHHDRSKSLRVITQHHEAETEEDYLTITHLRPNYHVLYLTAYNEQFVLAMKDIEKAPAVGVDAEYKLERGANVPTYLQVADDTKAYVFNLKLIAASTESQHMLKAIWDFLTSKKPKIGQSLAHDLYEVSQWIIPRLGLRSGPQIVECWSLEEKLFITMPSRTLGLTHISFRHLGKHMRKKQKECSAGGQRTIDNELQMEYVALDALAPLVIYQKYRGLVENLANIRKFTPPNQISDQQALVPPLLLFDWNLMGDATGWKLEGFKKQELEAFTVDNLPTKLATHRKRYPGLVFIVTADIPVISNSKLKDSDIIPYYSKTNLDEQLQRIRDEIKKRYSKISATAPATATSSTQIRQTPTKPTTGKLPLANGADLLTYLNGTQQVSPAKLAVPIVNPAKANTADPLINYLQGKTDQNPAKTSPPTTKLPAPAPAGKKSQIVPETPYYQSAIPTATKPTKPEKKAAKKSKGKRQASSSVDGKYWESLDSSMDDSSSRDLKTDSDDHTPEPIKNSNNKPAVRITTTKLEASTTAKMLPESQLWAKFAYALKWSTNQTPAGEPCIPIKTVKAFCTFCGREEKLLYHENHKKSLRVLGCNRCGNGLSKQVDDDSMDVDQFYKLWFDMNHHRLNFAQPVMASSSSRHAAGPLPAKRSYAEFKYSKGYY